MRVINGILCIHLLLYMIFFKKNDVAESLRCLRQGRKETILFHIYHSLSIIDEFAEQIRPFEERLTDWDANGCPSFHHCSRLFEQFFQLRIFTGHFLLQNYTLKVLTDHNYIPNKFIISEKSYHSHWMVSWICQFHVWVPPFDSLFL